MYSSVMVLRDYPRFLTPETKPFDPIKVMFETEKIVCHNDKRKYTDFYSTGVYGGIATGYTVGCMLRCFFCWVGFGREYPERFGNFYSPDETFSILSETARRKGLRKLRISGGEPTIGKEHLLGVLERISRSNLFFILETNGIYFGYDEEYVRELSAFRNFHVRLSLKAGTPENFERKTGAKREFFRLPFEGIRKLLRYRISFHVASMTADPRIVSADERRSLIREIERIHPKLVDMLEEEVVDPYDATIMRLRMAKVKLKFPKYR